MSSWNFKDLTDLKFGRLTVIERAGKNKYGNVCWRCRCDCGNFCTVAGGNLTKGNTKSCGCLGGGKLKDLAGLKFGRLTVLERADNKGRYTVWRCRCDCGNVCVVTGNSLKSGRTKSCGCLHGQKHGMADTDIYNTWISIKQRCFNPKTPNYNRYGGRGITICDEWKDDFQAFYDYVSKLPHFDEKGYSLDRIDNNKGYEPDNIHWADAKTQARNTRRNIFVEYNGVKMTLSEAAEKSGVQVGTLWSRIQRGDRGERLFRPVRK